MIRLSFVDEVAPDAMQYALRLARWSGFKRELALPKAQIETDIEARASRMRIASRRIAAYATGEILLANFTHKLDHDSERESALQTRFITLPNVSRALMLFALDSAAEFNFSPGRAFTDRLANLRERFDIPQP